MFEFNLTTLLDLLGTFAFAISGIRLASGRNIDLFGAYIIGLVTAIGGGTLRDLLLGVTPFWMQNGSYFLVTASALLFTILLKDKILKLGNTLFLFDTIGLGLFTVVGVTRSLDAGLSPWVCIAMGAITGSFGGVIRDVLINQVPLLFQKDIYALVCIAGGLVYFGCSLISLPEPMIELLTAGFVILLRIAVIRFKIHLPILRSNATEEG